MTFDFDLLPNAGDVAVGPDGKVLREIPMKVFPYIDFSPHKPPALDHAVGLVGGERDR